MVYVGHGIDERPVEIEKQQCGIGHFDINRDGTKALSGKLHVMSAAEHPENHKK
jgi:hypothetical protein